MADIEGLFIHGNSLKRKKSPHMLEVWNDKMNKAWKGKGNTVCVSV